MQTFQWPRPTPPAGRVSSPAMMAPAAVSATFADLREVLTVREAAVFLRVGAGTLYDAIRRGEFPAVWIGRRVLVAKSQLATFLGIDPAADRAKESQAAGRAPRRATEYDRFVSSWSAGRL